MINKLLAVGLFAVVIGGCSQAPQDGKAQVQASDESASNESAESESGDYSFAQQRNHVPMRIQRFDTNHDGVLTPNEIPQRLRAWFAECDTNHDNIVTADEIHAYNRAHPHAHHQHHDGQQPQPQPQPQQTTL